MARTGWMPAFTASLDHMYASIVHKLSSSTFFSRGWGPISLLKLPSVNKQLNELGEQQLQVAWRAVRRGVHRGHAFEVLEGSFQSPGVGWLLKLPRESERGRVWLMRPLSAAHGPTGMSGCWLQLPATGEHTSKCGPSVPICSGSSVFLRISLRRAEPAV